MTRALPAPFYMRHEIKKSYKLVADNFELACQFW